MRLNLRLPRKKSSSRSRASPSTTYGQWGEDDSEHAEHESSQYLIPTSNHTISGSSDHSRNANTRRRENGGRKGKGQRSYTQSVLAGDMVNIVVPKASMSSNIEQKLTQFCTEKLIDAQRRLTRLYGREKEIELLNQEVDLLVTSEKHHSLIQLTGEQGEGKTALALQLQAPAERLGCFFVMGKFDAASTEQPYSGIKVALAHLIQEKILKGLPPEKLKRLRDEISQKMSWEIDVMSQLIPEIALVARKSPRSSTNEIQSTETDGIFSRTAGRATQKILRSSNRSSLDSNSPNRPRKVLGLQRTLTPQRREFIVNEKSAKRIGDTDSSRARRPLSATSTRNMVSSSMIQKSSKRILSFRRTKTQEKKESTLKNGPLRNSDPNTLTTDFLCIEEEKVEEKPRKNQKEDVEEKPKKNKKGGRISRKNRIKMQAAAEGNGASDQISSVTKARDRGIHSDSERNSARNSAERLSVSMGNHNSVRTRTSGRSSLGSMSAGNHNGVRTRTTDRSSLASMMSISMGNHNGVRTRTSGRSSVGSKLSVPKSHTSGGNRFSMRSSIASRVSSAGNRSSVGNRISGRISLASTSSTPRSQASGSRSSVQSAISKVSIRSPGGSNPNEKSMRASKMGKGRSVFGFKRTLTEKMESNNHLNDNKEEGYAVGAGGADRLQFALRKFINVISSFAPLVLVCADIQWADSASINLLKGWITDDKNPIIMVWIYNKKDVGPYHFVTKARKEVEQLQEERSIRMTNINLGHLMPKDVNAMISDTLNAEPSETEDLAKILHQKTNGSAFFVTQYLQLFAQKGLLTYQMATLTWDWDLEEIRRGCSATQNVADLMEEKLQQSPAARQILPLAACIGATFDIRVLQAILHGLRGSQDQTVLVMFSTALGIKDVHALLVDDGRHLLEQIEKDGLIQMAGNMECTFVHEKVMEGALSLIEDGMLDDLKFAMGYLLLQQLDSHQEVWVQEAVFLLVDLLNCRLDMIPPTRQVDACELNLRAGDKAFLAAAYSRSAIYYGAAIELLPEDHWKTMYDASLHIYISAAESEMCLGNYGKMEAYLYVLLELDCPQLDKLPAYKVLIDAHMARAELVETLELNKLVLKELGFHFPKNGILVRTVAAVSKLKRNRKKWRPDSLSALPISSNPIHEAISQMHGILLEAVMMAQPEAFPLAIIMACKHVLDHGLTRYSALSLAWLGVVIVNSVQDFQWAKEHMDFTQSLLQTLPNRRIESKVNGVVSGVFVNHWTSPIHSSIKPLIENYSKGMETCDFDSAFWSAHFYLEASLYAGKSLALLQKDVETYYKQAVDYKMTKHEECLQCLWQLILNLRGCSENTVVLTGTAHDESFALAAIEETQDLHLLAHLQKDRLFAAAIFGDYKHGAHLGMSSLKLVCNVSGGQHFVVVTRFVVGLCCFEMARRTRNKNYLKVGKKNVKIFKSWSERGNPNATHYLLFLQAEQAVYEGKHDDAISLYERTILLSGRSGYRHDCALASERLADHLVRQGDILSAKVRFQDSLELYDEWGAVKKVELLRTKIDSLFSDAD